MGTTLHPNLSSLSPSFSDFPLSVFYLPSQCPNSSFLDSSLNLTSQNHSCDMPTWWVKKCGTKTKDDNHHHLLQNKTRGVINTRGIITGDNKTSVDPPTPPSRSTPRCSREFAGGSSSAFFSGFDSDSIEKKCHPLPRPSVSSFPNDHVTGSTSGSASVSSVSSSGSGDDHGQLGGFRGNCDVKFNVVAVPRSPERVSPKAVARPTSPLHNRLSGVSLDSSTGSSECHRLPLPPTSPTSPSAVPVHGSRIGGGGGSETSSLGFSKWKKGKFLGAGTFGQVYQGFNR